MRSHFALLLTVLVVLLALPTRASAYLDPGTGSMVLQMAIGGVLAVLAATRLYWGRITSFLRGKARPDSSQE